MTQGLSSREAQRRLAHFGPNELRREAGPSLWRDLVAQLIHPLAILLELAAVLAWASESAAIALAIVAVVILNAVLAVWQERQAERAIEALQEYLPQQARVVRDGHEVVIPARTLVPGDLLCLEEGDGISADARLVDGSLEVDMSTLNGESAPVVRMADASDDSLPRLEQLNLVFSGTAVTEGSASAVVQSTGMHTELGRVAALSQRTETEQSPLQLQVRRVAWLLALIAFVSAVAFIPLGMLFAGLPLHDAALFGIGLLVANVPEGLLPTITLALAVGVRRLASQRALVKRLSAVETLGSTTVICTDKTGTLTQNRMELVDLWSPLGGGGEHSRAAGILAACNNAHMDDGTPIGDPTEVALLTAAQRLGAAPARRLREFHFDPSLKRMATIDEIDGEQRVHVKGAPDVLLELATSVRVGSRIEPLDAGARARITATIEGHAARGLRLIAVAERVAEERDLTGSRPEVERDLTLVAIAALSDPPRPEVAEAVRRCHAAGIRIHVVTGDHGKTALAIAQSVGIGRDNSRVVEGPELDAMSEAELDRLLSTKDELIFARSSPEAKLRIADALRDLGETVAMTGDGVNDAPALRRADIGVAMGIGGTDVAREAATMILTDDNFATIVTAVEEGRRVYQNIRKFIVYIFAHLPPEAVPFLAFALSGGAIPLPLTALQILAIDLGTETLPALALGRERAEPGIMSQPPRPRSEGVLTGALFRRAWLFLGMISAALVMGAFFVPLLDAGWSLGDSVDAGSPFHHAYIQATTMTFLAIVA
ncbi:MAG TPA: cation-translocating P-type ATPase, partial [Gemmatimonadaceae bacterium]|nr:cation-translocating P-type ATPase [Gemmatimonadaceae bacterium]